MSGKGKYIYGIVEESQFKEFDVRGLDSAIIYTLNYRELAGIVSDTELTDIDPTRKNVMAHTLVQDEILKTYTLRPMSFGTVARDEKSARELLVRNYEDLAKELKRLSGKVEIGLKIFWDEKAMVQHLQDHNFEISRLRAQIGTTISTTAKAQSLLIEVGKLVERAALDLGTRCSREVLANLGEVSLDSHLNKPIGIQNIFNASFLIDRDRESEFRERIHRLDETYQGRVNFKYIGPLSPYSFVNLRLEAVK
jgi:hypothetical protein